MSYLEELPEGCPPDKAEEIRTRLEVFRLVRNARPSEEDFRSQRAEKPDQVFHRVTECQARGLSVHTERDDSERALKLPNLRGRLICRLQLDAGAGCIQQTGLPSHHTWWPLADFDILGRCSVEVP